MVKLASSINELSMATSAVPNGQMAPLMASDGMMPSNPIVIPITSGANLS
jgi:hypothetical protein